MRILVNYDKAEQNFLPVLQFFLKKNGLEAIATSSTLSIGELIAKAQTAQCKAIFLCNSKTLENCVPGTKPTLDDWRGSLLNFSVPTIVGNSLAHTQTIPYGSWLLEKDLARFKSLNPIPDKQKFAFTVLETTDLFEDAYHELAQAEFIAYDIETKTINVDEGSNTAGDTIITCCSWTGVYSDRSLRTYVLPLVSFLQNHWNSDTDYCKAISFLRGINALSVQKVMHNGMYDCMHSIVYRAYPKQWTLDTMAMMHSEFSELPKSLDFVASVTLPDYCQWKAEAQEASKSGDIQRYWAYNAKDTWTTARICLYYLDKLPAYAKKNYQDQFKLVYPALYCNFEGFKINQEKRLELRNKEAERLEKNLRSLRITLSDAHFNPGSWQQVGKYIYDILGASDPKIGKKRTATGGKVTITRGTDEKNLSAVGQQHPLLLRVTSAIINYREAQKAIGTYMDFLQKNGRLLYSLNPFGTETGRMACQASSLWCGTQVQNIPYYAKPMLVADEGFILCEPDFSQAEARCTAYLSQEVRLIAALENKDRDFYTSLGTLFFSIPYENVTKDFRNKILKKIVHGTNYMMGAGTFVENAGTQNLIDSTVHLGIKVSLNPSPKDGSISLKQYAQKLLDSYHVPFFRVKEWYQEIKNEIITTHKLRSPLGHTRYFFGDVSKNHMAFNSAVAHAPQNLSVSMLNVGFWKVWGLVKKHNGDLRLKAQVHDSVPFQYREGREDIRDEVLAALDNPAIIHGRTLRIPVEAKIGNNWGEMEELK
jgi:DNA polymerase I-like protein with 3'-5' exonuclease and polymerase domains